MANTKKRKTKARPKSRKTIKSQPRKGDRPIDVTGTHGDTGIEMKGERLVVKLSRESHPDVFEIDRMVKHVQKVRESNKGNRKLRNFCEFLAETEKSLQIILSNHLDAALRKYLR